MTIADNCISIIMLIVCGGIVAWIFCALMHLQHRAELERLNDAAERYFVKVCFTKLTQFGSETDALEYYTFHLIDNELHVILVTRSTMDNIDESNQEVVLRFEYDGLDVVDCKTKRVYSHPSFENELNRLLGDERVYASQIESLWTELWGESESAQN